ncbi:carbonic anhydrase [Chytridium lagenaria]|nr:carbonic anhydrase [Chytridium lagenaria]
MQRAQTNGYRMVPAVNSGAAAVESPAGSHGETLMDLLENNRRWADKLRRESPGLLERLAATQTPEVLWIGCSDSRVPAESVVGLGPGDLFVHRNIANVVCHTDLSFLSVLQYAVDVLKVKHIIVCGHYKCGGCAAAMSSKQYGLIDNWLRSIKDVYSAHKHVLDQIPDEAERLDMLVEFNVARSVHNICRTTVVQNAWARGQYLSVHGWSYRLDDAKIRDLELCINSQDEVEGVYAYATAAVKSRESMHGGKRH